MSKPWSHERNLIGEHLISRVVVVSLFEHVGMPKRCSLKFTAFLSDILGTVGLK